MSIVGDEQPILPKGHHHVALLQTPQPVYNQNPINKKFWSKKDQP